MTAVPTNVVRATRADVKALAGSQLRIVDRDLLTPPGSPANDARYLMPAAGTILGAWASAGILNGEVAHYIDGAWERETPADGWRFYIIDEGKWVERISGSIVDMPTKAYVDGLAVNLGKRQRVRVATTANITIATALNNGDTLDGVTLATGDLVLVKDQSAGAENGVYVVGVSPARAAEFDTYDEHPGSLIAVAEGTANADSLWLCTSNAGGTLDSTAIVFARTAQDFNTASLDVSGETTSPKRSLPARFGDVLDPSDFGVNMANGTPSTTAAAAWDAMAAYANTNSKLVYCKNKLVRLAAGAGASVMPLQMRELRVLGDLVNSNTALPSRTALTIVGMEGANIWAGGYANSALDSSASRGAWSIDLANNNISVAVGDVLQLYENAQWGHTDFACKMSEVVTVYGFALNTPSSGKVRVYLTGALQGNYTSSATARKFPASDLKWEGVTITGKDDGIANQEALSLIHFRKVELTDVEGIGCYDKALGVYNCAEVLARGVKGKRAGNPGLGYAWDDSGSSNVKVLDVSGPDCKHLVTGGLGINGILSRMLDYPLINGDGADSLFDKHAGAVDVHVGSIMGRGRSQSGTEGDLVVFQGAGLRIDSIIGLGARRDGVLLQPFGDGDGAKRAMSIGYARLESTSSVDGFALQYDGTYANSQAPRSVAFDRVDARWKRGAYFDVKNGTVEELSVGAGYIESTSNYSGVTVLCGTSGVLKSVNLGKAGELRVKVPASVSSIYPLDFLGASGTVIDRAIVDAVHLDGGDYAIHATYATVLYNYALLTRANQASGLSSLGTSGVLTARNREESGSITPTIAGGSTAGTTGYTLQQGAWKRIGDVVFFWLRVRWNSQSGSGQILVGGLPYASVGAAAIKGAYGNLTVGGSLEFTPVLEDTRTYISLYSSYAAGGGLSSIGMDTACDDLILSGSYLAA